MLDVWGNNGLLINVDFVCVFVNIYVFFSVISSVDSFQEVINSSTSQNSQSIGAESTKKHIAFTKFPSTSETDTSVTVEPKVEQTKSEATPEVVALTATELLSASIEKLAREQPQTPDIPEIKEASSAIQAQAKLTQSIASCIRTNQPESKMKDINLNNKPTG